MDVYARVPQRGHTRGCMPGGCKTRPYSLHFTVLRIIILIYSVYPGFCSTIPPASVMTVCGIG